MCGDFFSRFPSRKKRGKAIRYLFLCLLIFGGISFGGRLLQRHGVNGVRSNGLFWRNGDSEENCTVISQRSPPPVTDAVVPSPSPSQSAPSSCPDYFRWIHEDLRPWKQKGITKEMVERAGKSATFRLLIVSGKIYVESYSKSIQTRDIFTWWGFLQILRKYDGLVPDLDLMFDCEDRPVINARDFFPNKGQFPPPLFRYCKDDESLEILFPDWSFWGWPEIEIKPWMHIVEELKEGNKQMKWIEREPYAYWKGNPVVSPVRQDLLKCNVSLEGDWKARLFVQDWNDEKIRGYKHSNLAGQCTYRYKIYIEGWAWSVSQKYILACDSPTLMVESKYYEFFSRALEPLKHYWPISKETKCKSIKFAVDWGNFNKEKAQNIGRNASNFIMEELKMDYVYDYMFHLLKEYSRLLRYKPKVPPNAKEVSVDSMLATANGTERRFMISSMFNVTSQASTPCSFPTLNNHEVRPISKRTQEALRLVQCWQKSNLSSVVYR